jgi:hypothetical protein
MRNSESTSVAVTSETTASSWSDVRAVWAALFGFLLGWALLSAVEARGVLAVFVLAMVVATSSWFSTLGIAACISVIGYLVASAFVDGASSTGGNSSEGLLLVSLTLLGLLASVAGRRRTHAAFSGHLRARASSLASGARRQ